jgi:hypothetical protein
MKKILAVLCAFGLAAVVFAQSGIILPAGSSTLRSIHFSGYPGLGIYSSSAGVMEIGTAAGGISCTNGSGCTAILTGLSGTTLTTATLTSPTLTSPTMSDPTSTGTSTLNQVAFSLTADAAVNYGNTVMPDASAASRFDVNTGSATAPLGILGGSGPSAQGTAYPVIFGGIAEVALAEDQDGALGEWIVQSATAGKCNATTIGTIGLNVGRILRTAPVTAVIDPAGCTGAAGCINTALDTPNAGPAGQFTLGVDVAAAGWAVGDAVVFWDSGGTVPTGITDGKTYFLLSVATTNVTIAATRGGTVVVPSTQGTDATQYLQRLPLVAVHVY